MSQVLTPEVYHRFNAKGDACAGIVGVCLEGDKIAFTGCGSMIAMHFTSA